MNATYVLFGATGDLATRKILPSLAHAALGDLSLVATSRRPWSSEQYRDFLRPYLSGVPGAEEFLARIEYHQLSFDDAAGYQALREKITTPAALYHLSIEPQYYARAARGLGEAGLTGTLLVEKPFGHDAASAAALEQELEHYFSAEHIVRIDHYLAKDGLRNFVPPQLQGRGAVTKVTCRIEEDFGIEGRGEFYDATGALRDVGQNHCLAMLATVLMAPGGTRAESLRMLAPADPAHAIFGQYEGYTEEPEVGASSKTETYFYIEAQSRDPRWAGVPLVLVGGKALARKASEIEIIFADGTRFVQPLTTPPGGEYALLCRAALAGEHSLFVSYEEVIAAWEFLAPVLAAPPAPLLYQKGSAGPRE